MRTFFVSATAASLLGCATVAPPGDLLTARSTYERASHGPTATLDPADLHVGKDTLDQAEMSFTKNGDTQETRDLAYTADRQIQIAEARGRTLQATRDTAKVVSDLNASQAATVRTTAAALNMANAAVGAEAQALDSEHQQLLAAQELARIASVKRESRGLVITLSGSVLFASGKSDVLPDAGAKLDMVAKALSQQDPNSTMLVEGFTDSQGSATFNQDLSQRRAASVREYLIGRGIASDRITAEGFGMGQPIASNASPEGRANNRRVEIVVKPAAH